LEFQSKILQTYAVILYAFWYSCQHVISLHGFKVMSITLLTSTDFRMLQNLRTKPMPKKSHTELDTKQLSDFIAKEMWPLNSP